MTIRLTVKTLLTLSATTWTLSSGQALGASCENLTALTLPHGTVTSAAIVPAGGFTPPAPQRGGNANANPYKSLPEFCRAFGFRVDAVLICPDGNARDLLQEARVQ